MSLYVLMSNVSNANVYSLRQIQSFACVYYIMSYIFFHYYFRRTIRTTRIICASLPPRPGAELTLLCTTFARFISFKHSVVVYSVTQQCSFTTTFDCVVLIFVELENYFVKAVKN